jgi:hypothetical protein
MWKDPIIEEIHKYRDNYSKQFNYDLKKICEDIQQRQGQNNRPVVIPTPRPVKNFYGSNR